MKINWYPGHMKKTYDLIKQNLKLVDCIVELLDARIPLSSKNPIFDTLIVDKPRVVAFTKMDLADPNKLSAWVDEYLIHGIQAIPIDGLHGKGINKLLEAVKTASVDKFKKYQRQNRQTQKIRMMIIGIPNVGKSSLINQLAGTKAAKTGNRPGVTKGKQWIKVDNEIELFDTPGILWPKIESDTVGLNLAYTGSIKDEILSIEDIALYFLRDVVPFYHALFETRYNIDIDLKQFDALQVMEKIAIKRGCILSKKNIDYHRVGCLILDEFRKGTIGLMTLEIPK